jgi:TRAP transporter TAXI family solute receptor
MRRRQLLVAGLLLAGSPASAQPTTTLRLGTTPEGGGFAPYTVALVETLKPIDHGLAIRTVDTDGSTDNAERLKAGSIDLGLMSGEVFNESESREPGRLKVVSVMYYTPGMFAVLSNSPHKSITDLRGAPVIWGPRGTGSAVQARYVMGGLGLDLERDFQAIYPSEFTDGPPLIFSGKAAAMWGSGLRQPAFVTIAKHPIGVRFIVPTQEEIARIRATYPFLVPLTVRARTYPGQSHPVTTVGSWSFIVARPELDPAIARRLAADLHKAEQQALKSPYLAQTTAANTLAGVTSFDELHPGVLGYYKDAGLAP